MGDQVEVLREHLRGAAEPAVLAAGGAWRADAGALEGVAERLRVGRAALDGQLGDGTRAAARAAFAATATLCERRAGALRHGSRALDDAAAAIAAASAVLQRLDRQGAPRRPEPPSGVAMLASLESLRAHRSHQRALVGWEHDLAARQAVAGEAVRSLDVALRDAARTLRGLDVPGATGAGPAPATAPVSAPAGGGSGRSSTPFGRSVEGPATGSPTGDPLSTGPRRAALVAPADPGVEPGATTALQAPTSGAGAPVASGVVWPASTPGAGGALAGAAVVGTGVRRAVLRDGAPVGPAPGGAPSGVAAPGSWLRAPVAGGPVAAAFTPVSGPSATGPTAPAGHRTGGSGPDSSPSGRPGGLVGAAGAVAPRTATSRGPGGAGVARTAGATRAGSHRPDAVRALPGGAGLARGRGLGQWGDPWLDDEVAPAVLRRSGEYRSGGGRPGEGRASEERST